MDQPRAITEVWLQRLFRRTDLSSGDMATIRELPGRIDHIEANRDFVKLGERVTAACLVVDGLAARFGQTVEGERQLTALHIPGDCADLHSAVLPNPECALSAVTDSTIYRIPHEYLHRAAQSSPAIARAFWRDCTVDASIAGEWMLNNGRRDARARLAHLICELAVRYANCGADRDRFALPMTQIHMGDALSLTPVHVNRMLRRLREDGLVTIRAGVVEIADWNGLARAGEFSDRYLHLTRENPDTG